MTDRRARKEFTNLLARCDMVMGALSDAIVNQDDEFVDWLLRQVPEGANLSETLVAIAVDAKSEEQDENG